MFGESDKVSIGVVIRNSNGEVMAALLEKIKKPSSVEALKPLVARRAVSFTLESGFANCTFEGDFELVVKSLHGKGMENSQRGHIIKDILSYVNSLQSFSFPHVVRQSNAVAHALTQRARLSFPLLFWMESVLMEKHMFVSHTKHTQRKIHGSTSFAIDNMYYVNFRI